MLGDKKFIATALVIGLVYASIVLIVSRLIGKEAAGVVAVALTAIATAIFRQFENLKFVSKPTKEIPISFSFGSSLIIGLAILSLVQIVNKIGDSVLLKFVSISEDQFIRHASGDYDFLTDGNFYVLNYSFWGLALYCLAFAIGGFTSSKFIRTSYYEILVGSFITIILIILLDQTSTSLESVNYENLSDKLYDQRYACLYGISALIGAFFARQNEK